MRFGLTAFLTDVSVDPARFAREAEARGFDALFVPEHTHIPASRRTPAPMGEPLPEHYRRLFDPFAALAVAACATERLRVGTAICLVAQHDPIVLAKQVASLDHLTGGRFMFGIGYGWNVEEAADHGVEFKRRRDVVREKVLAMKRLWTEDVASYEGEFVRFSSSWSWPKPVQKPHPPVYIGGGAGPKLFAAVAEYADGWMPIGARGLAAAIPELHRAAEAAGRDPATMRVVPVGTIPEAGKLERLRALGIDEIVLGAETGAGDELFRLLDRYAEIVAPFRK